MILLASAAHIPRNTLGVSPLSSHPLPFLPVYTSDLMPEFLALNFASELVGDGARSAFE